MAKPTKNQKMPKWVEWMGKVTTGSEADKDGVFYPVGLEISDPVPMSIPAGMRTPPSLREQMDELFRVGRLREAAQADESVDEANDFDIDDYFGPDNVTPWQTDYDPLLGREISPAEFHEKYKSGELVQELKARWSQLDRAEEIEEIIGRLETAYREAGKPADSKLTEKSTPQPDLSPKS